MAQTKAVFSLTTDFRAKASPEDKAARKAVRDASIRRNKENQKALGAWHNESRGKMNEVPFPKRRSS
jgi:hypothetical protein